MKQQKIMCEGCPSRSSSGRISVDARLKRNLDIHPCHHDPESNCAGILARTAKGKRILLYQLDREASGVIFPGKGANA